MSKFKVLISKCQIFFDLVICYIIYIMLNRICKNIGAEFVVPAPISIIIPSVLSTFGLQLLTYR
jgi:hypothetical protein